MSDSKASFGQHVYQATSDHDNRHRQQDESCWTELQHLTSNSRTVTTSKWPRSFYSQGWRFGVICCAISTSVVFLINLTATVVWGFKVTGGLLLEGDCDQAKRINSGLHLLINALSIILLSSSNYCMQCLSAPTRRETDVAHARADWLDIGVQSIRNLRRIDTKRVVVWYLLGLSSLPLHLFYNAAVYMSIAAHDYQVYAVPQSFVDTSDCSQCTMASNVTTTTMNHGLQEIHIKTRNGNLTRLENKDCIAAYARILQTKRGDLLLVTDDNNVPLQNSSSVTEATSAYFHHNSTALNAWAASTQAYDWMCSALDVQKIRGKALTCAESFDRITSSPETWKIGNGMRSPIRYCLSEEVVSRCKVRWSVPIATLVTILNLVKAILMFYTAFGIKEEPLMTLGDAVSSYINRPDHATVGMCLVSFKDIRNKEFVRTDPQIWTSPKYRWESNTSKGRRVMTFFMLGATATVLLSFLAAGIGNMGKGQTNSFSNLVRLGFGTLDPRTAINTGVKSVIGNTLIANAPQVILSLVYFSYNSLFTCMLLGYEWATYARQHKGLRLSRSPRGAQRSTYFLSLPYRFAVPLIALSGALHWMVSQSIFFVAVEFYGRLGDLRPPTVLYSCGYSPIAILSVLALNGIMITIGIVMCNVHLPPGTNLVGSCSALMSAACHITVSQNVDEHDPATRRLKWGVVNVRADGVGHCAFSSGPVESLEKDRRYAG